MIVTYITMFIGCLHAFRELLEDPVVGTVNYPKSRRSVGRVNLGGIIDMAGFTKDLMGGQGCSVDGLAQARNPWGSLWMPCSRDPKAQRDRWLGRGVQW